MAKNASPAMKMKKHKGVLGRTLKLLFKYYPKMMTVALLCIIFNAVVSSLPSIFMQRLFSVAEEALRVGGGWEKYGGLDRKSTRLNSSHIH